MEYATISAKVPKDIKHKIDDYGIKPSEIIRKSIYDEIKKIEIMQLKEETESMSSIVKKIKSKSVVKSIREDRDR